MAGTSRDRVTIDRRGNGDVASASCDPIDRKLGKSIVDFVLQTNVARAVRCH